MKLIKKYLQITLLFIIFFVSQSNAQFNDANTFIVSGGVIMGRRKELIVKFLLLLLMIHILQFILSFQMVYLLRLLEEVQAQSS
jgi:hypothetical protein